MNSCATIFWRVAFSAGWGRLWLSVKRFRRRNRHPLGARHSGNRQAIRLAQVSSGAEGMPPQVGIERRDCGQMPVVRLLWHRIPDERAVGQLRLYLRFFHQVGKGRRHGVGHIRRVQGAGEQVFGQAAAERCKRGHDDHGASRNGSIDLALLHSARLLRESPVGVSEARRSLEASGEKSSREKRQRHLSDTHDSSYEMLSLHPTSMGTNANGG